MEECECPVRTPRSSEAENKRVSVYTRGKKKKKKDHGSWKLEAGNQLSISAPC